MAEFNRKALFAGRSRRGSRGGPPRDSYRSYFYSTSVETAGEGIAYRLPDYL